MMIIGCDFRQAGNKSPGSIRKRRVARPSGLLLYPAPRSTAAAAVDISWFTISSAWSL